MKWIMSDGGPMICMDARWATSWKGIFGLSVRSLDFATDYDRACASGTCTAALALDGGIALVIQTGPQDTAVWTSEKGITYIVSVVGADPDVDETGLLADISDAIFERPIGVAEIEFASDQFVMFDSAASGDDPDEKKIYFSIVPGRYRILTQAFDPNPEASFIVHKLKPLE